MSHCPAPRSGGVPPDRPLRYGPEVAAPGRRAGRLIGAGEEGAAQAEDRLGLAKELGGALTAGGADSSPWPRSILRLSAAGSVGASKILPTSSMDLHGWE